MSRRTFAVVFTMPLAAQIVLSAVGDARPWFTSPRTLFALVVVVATGCVMLSVALIARGWHTGAAELAWTGLFFLGASAGSLAHGLLVPGVLFAESPAFELSMLVAVPLGVTAASPLFAPRFGVVARAWRPWTVAWVVVIAGISLAMVLGREAMPTVAVRSIVAISLISFATVGAMLLAFRHVQLARIATSRGPLVVAAGYSLVIGSLGLLFFDQPWSGPFWVAHGLDFGGALMGVIGALFVYQQSSSMSDVLAPVLAIEPIAALEAGMTPEVREYIAALDRKDPLTRDHVVRTAELALEVAAYMRLTPESQRVVALTAALHDIGKIVIPDDVLNKPGVLTDDEWEVMRSHAAAGGEILAASEALSDLAPAVRAHHERHDGAGYPDGLVGDAIPLEAQIVAVCDAFDAMAYTRRYRSAMPLDEVVAVLKEHSGTQWDSMIVHAVVGIVTRRRRWEPQLLSDERQSWCDCLPQHLAEAAREAEAQLPAGAAFRGRASLS